MGFAFGKGVGCGRTGLSCGGGKGEEEAELVGVCPALLLGPLGSRCECCWWSAARAIRFFSLYSARTWAENGRGSGGG